MRPVAAALIILALLAPGAWPATPIADIVAEPERWAGREVTVVGTVLAPSVPYLGEGVYTLSAGERRITVFSKAGAPTVGTRLEVTARVRWREGDEEFTWPPVLLESTRRDAP